MKSAYLALGGNQGDVAATIRAACQQLAVHPQIREVQCSPLYRTAPVGTAAGEAFLNAAVCCQTSLLPEELLTVCQQMETQAGRVRQIHWGPRTLDIDLIGCDDVQWESSRLKLPHPAAWYRRFVLDPLCDIAADWWHPERQATVKQLRERLLQRPLILDVSAAPTEIALAAEELRTRFSPEVLQVHTAGSHSESQDLTLPTWQLIDPFDSPAEWAAASPLCRLSSRQWTSCQLQDLIDLVNSAVDEPQLTS